MAEQEKKIEKPWCVFGGYRNYLGYGKIVKESVVSVEIVHNEKPDCILALWNKEYIKRFDTLLEALKELYQSYEARGEKIPWEKLKEQAHRSFPSENLEEKEE